MGRTARNMGSCVALFLMLLAAQSCNQMAEKRAQVPRPSSPGLVAQVSTKAGEDKECGKRIDEAPPGAPAVERLIVKAAELRLLVESVDPVEPKLLQAVKEHGGFVVSAERSGTGDGATLAFTFRVPVDSFDAALSAVERLAKRVDYRKVSGQDVTEEYVDLDAQLKNDSATRDRILKIMERADKVEDVLAVNRELGAVQERIDRLQGKMKYLRQSAALSTVGLSLYPEARTPVVDEGGWRPAEVVRHSLRALLGLGKSLANLAIFLAVWTPVWLPIYWLFHSWRKRRRARRAAREAEKAAAAAAPRGSES